jgi:hypothetical protein
MQRPEMRVVHALTDHAHHHNHDEVNIEKERARRVDLFIF